MLLGAIGSGALRVGGETDIQLVLKGMDLSLGDVVQHGNRKPCKEVVIGGTDLPCERLRNNGRNR